MLAIVRENTVFEQRPDMSSEMQNQIPSMSLTVTRRIKSTIIAVVNSVMTGLTCRVC